MISLKALIILVVIIVLFCWYQNNNSNITEGFNTDMSFGTSLPMDQVPFTPDVINLKCAITQDRMNDIKNYEKTDCANDDNDQTLNYRQTNNEPIINQDVRETINRRKRCVDNTEREILYDINTSSWCSINTTNQPPPNNPENKFVDNPIKNDVLKTNMYIVGNPEYEREMVDQHYDKLNNRFL